MRQKLIIITGSPYVGKSTVTEKVFTMLENSAYLDGDWVWKVNPFSVRDPRLRNGDKNMSFTLSTYLRSQFEYVFFASVIATNPEIRRNILAGIDYDDYEILGITLTCSRKTLVERYAARGDGNRLTFYFLDQPPYPGDWLLNTDGLDADEVSRLIYDRIKE